MSSSSSRFSLGRYAGVLALGAGLLLFLQQLLMLPIVDRGNLPATMSHPFYIAAVVGYFVAFCGLLVALLAVQDVQAERAGRFGLVAFVLAVVGTTFLAGDLWFEAFAVPWLGDVAPAAMSNPSGMLVLGALASYLLFAAGWTLYGLATLRARLFPWPISVALVLGGLIGFQAALPPFAIPLAIALVSLGAWMVRRSWTRPVPRRTQYGPAA